jgi:protein-tyrosine phosphatase
MFSMIKRMVPHPLKRKIKRFFQNMIDSPVYLLSRNRLFDRNIRHIVFVCKGNICRSAFSEHYLKHFLSRENFRIESGGLDVDQGNFSPIDAVAISKKFKVDLSRHHSRGLSCCDLQNADLILTMEFAQYLRLIAIYPEYKGKIRLLRDFAPWPERLFCNIFDPFGHGQDEFNLCFGQMQRALDGLINHHFLKKIKEDYHK